MPYSNKAPKKAPAKTKLYSSKPNKNMKAQLKGKKLVEAKKIFARMNKAKPKKADGKPDTKGMKAKLKKKAK